jgi:hypothetical protein
VKKSEVVATEAVPPERTMATILRELREMLVNQPHEEADRAREPVPLSKEIQRIIRE